MLIPAFWRDVSGLLAGFGGRGDDASAVVVGRALALVTVEQVHGADVVAAAEVMRRAEASERVRADALVVTGAGLVAAVRTADCVPILLLHAEPTGVGGSSRAGRHGSAGGSADADGTAARMPRWAAAVHAGWRGTIAGIAAATVEAVRARGIRPADLEAAIGPAIGACCYEVGEEVAARFEEAGLPVSRPPGRARLDLRAINALLLERAGLRRESIHTCGPCTRCRSDLYYSYRADPSERGRQLSWIGW